MSQTVVPMIHVPDVGATIGWYTSIGFTLVREGENDGEIVWAKLSFGNSKVMLDAGGKPSTEHLREVDLYITTDNVDDCTDALGTAFKSWKDFMMPSTEGVSSSFVTSTDSGSRSDNLYKRSWATYQFLITC
jgi:hypothetical protein